MAVDAVGCAWIRGIVGRDGRMAKPASRQILWQAAWLGLVVTNFFYPLQMAGAATRPQPSSAPGIVENSALSPLQAHTFENIFAIGLPPGWQINHQTTAPQFIATMPATPTTPAIRTEVTWHNQPPRLVVAEDLQRIKTKGYTVARYDVVSIDKTSAVRVWLTDLPDGLPHALIAYVGYDNATAVIVSYYGAQSPAVDTLINGIHQSFHRLPPAGSQ